MSAYSNNIIDSLSLLNEAINRRLHHFFQKENTGPFAFPEIQLEQNNPSLNHFLVKHQVNVEEHIILLLSLAPHIQPNFLDAIIQQYLPNGGDFPEIGGVKGNNHRGTMATGETALFILAGNDINKRIQVAPYFSPDHFFANENILQLETLKEGEPRMSGKIILQQEYVDLFTIGTITKPTFGTDFPAKLVTTKMEWDDVVLNSKTAQAIHDIKIWLHHNVHFMQDWGMEKRVKPGYRTLF